MNQRRCHRCGSEVPAEAEGLLVYCSRCGAPQIKLSEELQEQAALLANGDEAAAGNTEAPAAELNPVAALNWNLLIRISAYVAGALTVLSLVLAPFALLVWIWAPVAPAVVLALYAARIRGARLDLRCGARIGAVCGLLIVAGQALVNATALDVMRFGLKHAADIDAGLTTVFAPLRTQLAAQYGSQSAAIADLAIPEFRAGFVLASLGTLTVAVVGLATTGGAVAGALRSRARPV